MSQIISLLVPAAAKYPLAPSDFPQIRPFFGLRPLLGSGLSSRPRSSSAEKSTHKSKRFEFSAIFRLELCLLLRRACGVIRTWSSSFNYVCVLCYAIKTGYNDYFQFRFNVHHFITRSSKYPFIKPYVSVHKIDAIKSYAQFLFQRLKSEYNNKNMDDCEIEF